MTVPEPQPTTEQELRVRIADLERELAVTRERLRRLEEIDRIQADFVFAISHELRTPLTLISGYAQKLLLRWGMTDDERQRVMIEKINVSSHRLSRLIDDMLLMSDVERDELPVHRRDIVVAEVVDVVLSDLRDRYPDGLPAIAVEGDRALQVRTDGFRLEQVLLCLVDNAVKHAPSDSTVTLRWQATGAGFEMSVSDQGSGIAPADIPRLFMRFGRLERVIGQSRGGVGLGLYIARHLVEAMGGRIWVESTPGKGSTFYVHVPVT